MSFVDVWTPVDEKAIYPCDSVQKMGERVQPATPKFFERWLHMEQNRR